MQIDLSSASYTDMTITLTREEINRIENKFTTLEYNI